MSMRSNRVAAVAGMAKADAALLDRGTVAAMAASSDRSPGLAPRKRTLPTSEMGGKLKLPVHQSATPDRNLCGLKNLHLDRGSVCRDAYLLPSVARRAASGP